MTTIHDRSHPGDRVDLFKRGPNPDRRRGQSGAGSLLLSSLAQARWAGGETAGILPDAERAQAQVLGL